MKKISEFATMACDDPTAAASAATAMARTNSSADDDQNAVPQSPVAGDAASPSPAASVTLISDLAAQPITAADAGTAADLHALGDASKQRARNAASSVGAFRRALSARRDLSMRRQLCRIGKVRMYILKK